MVDDTSETTCPRTPMPCATAASVLLIDPQPIADAGLGQDMRGPLGIRLDLLPQGTDVDTQVLHIGVAAPHLLQDHPVRQDLSGMLHQQPQQRVFARGELHRLAADGDNPAHQIDGQIAAAEYRRFASLLQAVALRGPDPRQQFLDPERLRYVIVSPAIQRMNLSRLVTPY